MALKDDILRALERMPGPDGRTPLPRSGALSDIVVDGGRVTFSIAIDPARSADLEPMRRRAEEIARAVAGVGAALVTLTADRPMPATARPPGPRAAAAQRRTGIPGVERIIAVASGKGGVGKSTTACNIALGLAASGLRVGILDADIYGPSMPRLLGLSGKPELAEGNRMRPLRNFGVEVMSIGFLVDERTPMVWRGPMVMSALNQMLHEVAWSPLDILVVDMPPGTGDAQLSLSQGVPLAGAVIVSTPQDLALLDARRGIAMFEQVAVPVLGVVENMSYFLCPQCGSRSDVFGAGGARREAEALGVPFLGEVPLHMRIRETSDAGTPVVASDPDGAEAAAYRAIAAALWARLSGTVVRAAPRIVIE